MIEEIIQFPTMERNEKPQFEFVQDSEPEDDILAEINKHTTIEPDETTYTEITEPQNKPQNTFVEGQPQNLNIGSLLSGEMSIDLLNLLLPVILAMVIKTVTGKECDKKQLTATESEKDIIAPALQNYLNSINFTVESPLNALIITLSIVYGSKTIEVLTNTKKGTLKPDFEPIIARAKNPNETRGRHSKKCNCTKCTARRKSF